MAGAGYKLFATGDVLTAAQVNTYLNEQTVMVFADSAARTAALSGVLAEGMVSYLQDTNAVEVYNGTAWVGVSGAGDVTEVQAGVGISVASGTGPIPIITNSSTDLITTAGDLLYGTAADTVARLGIGTASQVLAVNSGATAPEWVTPAAGGGKVLQVVFGNTLTQATSTSATFADTGITASITPSSASSKVLAIFNVNGIFKNTTDTYADIRFLRDATVLFTSGRNVANDSTDAETSSTSISILDTPATTSAITYKAQFNSAAGTTQTRVQFLNVTTSTVILMEIGA